MDEIGRFRVIAWDGNKIADMVEFSMNQPWTKRFLQKYKRRYTKLGYRVEVETVFNETMYS